MATPSSVLTWLIPWTEEPGGYSPWGQTQLSHTHTHTHTHLLLTGINGKVRSMIVFVPFLQCICVPVCFIKKKDEASVNHKLTVIQRFTISAESV